MGSSRGTVLRSLACHYCGERASTEDHIVPRADLPKPMAKVPYWFRSLDVVPSCLDCNGRKSWFRSDCACEHCTWAWNTAKNVFLPEGYVERGWIALQRNTTLALPLAEPVPSRDAYPGQDPSRDNRREQQALSS